MKILYAVQATGNGHISRATEILPYLLKYGEVDVFLSGSNYALEGNLPVVYRSKGISLAYNQSKGSIDLLHTLRKINGFRIWQEINDLPVEQYDLVINDFEAITSIACAIKRKPSIHFGHQASFTSKYVPRPVKRNSVGEWILANYAKGSQTIGLHFKKYDRFIFPPIIKETIVQAEPLDLGHITIYLGQYNLDFLVNIFTHMREYRFHIFSASVTVTTVIENCTVMPIGNESFSQSMITCHGLITGAGFETPAEALYLRKKLMIIPLKGQYEQYCNAAALERDFNVPVIYDISKSFSSHVQEWLANKGPLHIKKEESNEEIVNRLFSNIL